MNPDEKQMARTRKNKSFGSIIQEYRQRYGWTQEELGWRAGITREHVGRIERDKCVPSVLTIECLEKALHLPPMSLMKMKLNPAGQPLPDSEEEKCVGHACRELEYALVTNLTKPDMLKASDVISTISDLLNHNEKQTYSK